MSQEFEDTARAIATIEERGDAFANREKWLDTMADLKAEHDRDFEILKARVVRLERKATLLTMNEEMKSFLVMTGVSVAVAILIPMLQAAIEKWRRSQS